MTLGEKIKEARKQCGLSQEQMADTLAVSRSAVAKWETDNGMPDIDNLRALARVLNVSIDYLLDNGEDMCVSIVRENFDMSKYEKGTRRKKKDCAIRDRFPRAVIYPLLANEKMSKGERFLDNLIGFLTDAPFGVPQIISGFKNADKQYYMVEENEKQMIVVVTDEFFEIRYLATPIRTNKFEMGNLQFTKCSYTVK